MKVIITGATGYIGSEVLKQSLLHPKITSVVALTRRPLSESRAKDIVDLSNPKLQAIIHEDLTSYPPDLMAKLSGADACIWSLGTVPSKHDPKETARTSTAMPKAAIQAWNGKLKGPGEDPFRFVLVSGALVERDQGASLAMQGEFRKMRGETENILAMQEEDTPETWKSFMLRMGKVFGANQTILSTVVPWGTIKIDDAAACMIDLALHAGSKQTLSNDEMKALGKKALEKMK